jgi:hypothetical protein
MSWSNVTEKPIRGQGRPEAVGCRQCEDTGFVMTAWGLQECPLCREDEAAPDTH